MNILLSIFKEVDRATGRIVRNAVKETIKAGRRILVKGHMRKGRRVEGHTRIIQRTAGAKGRRPRRPKTAARKQRGQVGRAKRKQAKQGAHDDSIQAYIEDLTSNPEHQAWLRTHGGLCAVNWQAGRCGDEDTFLLSYLLIQNPRY